MKIKKKTLKQKKKKIKKNTVKKSKKRVIKQVDEKKIKKVEKESDLEQEISEDEKQDSNIDDFTSFFMPVRRARAPTIETGENLEQDVADVPVATTTTTAEDEDNTVEYVEKTRGYIDSGGINQDQEENRGYADTGAQASISLANNDLPEQRPFQNPEIRQMHQNDNNRTYEERTYQETPSGQEEEKQKLAFEKRKRQ